MRLLLIGLMTFVVLCFPIPNRADESLPAGEHSGRHVHSHQGDDDGHHDRDDADHVHAREPLPHSHSSKSDGSADVPVAAATDRWSIMLLGLYCVAIIGASLFGGWIPHRFEPSHTVMQLVISLIGGFMLGVGVLHMLPHALVELGDNGPDLAAYGMMAGLLVMFFLLRLFHFHHHGPTEVPCAHHLATGGHDQVHTGPERDQVQGHVHVPALTSHGRNLSWVGVFLGMSLHTLIDGLALGASVAGDSLHGPAGLLGFGTFVAVVLHKPLDSLAITSVMAASGWSPGSRTLVNAGFSLICPLGTALFLLGMDEFSGRQAIIVGCALAVSAGVFLCIALSDLLPEMEFHSHNRFQLTAALLVGVALAWGIRFLEPAHAHSHQHVETAHSRTP